MKFKETQHFRQWWGWLIITCLLCLDCWALTEQLILGRPWGNHPSPDAGLLIISVIVFCIVAIFIFSSLQTVVDQDGVHYRYRPFQISFRSIKWQDIENITLRDQRPIKEFGGWGIRGTKKKRALTVSGKHGIQLTLKDGRQLFIGTQRPDELSEVLKQSGKINY